MIDITTGFNLTSNIPIDSRLIKTKAEMKSVDDRIMPDVYFCVCSEDGQFYLYDKSNEPDDETGRFSKAVDPSNIPFDNTGTNLFSDNVQDAIAEVNAKTLVDATAFTCTGKHRISSSGKWADSSNTDVTFVCIPMQAHDVISWQIEAGSSGGYGAYTFIVNRRYTDDTINNGVIDEIIDGYIITENSSSGVTSHVYEVPPEYDACYYIIAPVQYSSSYAILTHYKYIKVNGMDAIQPHNLKDWAYDLVTNYTKNDVVNLNGGESVLDVKLLNMKYGDTSKSDSGKNYKKCCCLIHCSDIHGDSSNIARLIKFWDTYKDTGATGRKDIINGCIYTGDLVPTYFKDDISGAMASIGARPFLLTMGNHDAWPEDDPSQPYALDDNAEYWPWASAVTHEYSKPIAASECYNKFYKDYIGAWEVESAGENKCYYYKNFMSDDHNQRYRLIVLDVCHQNTDQYNWFKDVLSDSKTNFFHVIVATHFEAGEHKRVPIPFSSFEYGDASTQYAAPDFRTAVTEFMDDGGTFVCWLSGHQHCDGVGVTSTDTRILDVNVATASSAQERTADSFVVPGTKSQDCFNIISIDYTDKILKVMRIGRDYDRYMQHKDTFCYNYGTHKMMYPIVSPDPTNS